MIKGQLVKVKYENFFYEKFKKNFYSQNGEDGVINEILNILEIKNGWVCEFGSWDGIHRSNTFNQVKKGFNAVYIEVDKNKYEDLLVTCEKYPNITPINAFVDHIKHSENSLDNLLGKTELHCDFLLLSIDIDSYDYQVWRSLQNYKPIIVIIEINSEVFPLDKNHIHKPNKYNGTGFYPMFMLGIEKGYKFLLHTGNMFFIRKDYFGRLNIKEPEHFLNNFRRIWLNQKKKEKS